MQEGPKANGSLAGGNYAIEDAIEAQTGPPKATVARRAQSYSDFHDAAKAVLDRTVKRAKGKDNNHEAPEDMKDDLGFLDWYEGLENDILESSHDEYK